MLGRTGHRNQTSVGLNVSEHQWGVSNDNREPLEVWIGWNDGG